MNARTPIAAMIFALLLAGGVFAESGLSGNWGGTSELVNREGQTRTGPIHLVLKQNGAEVTGTAGPAPDRQRPFENGRLEGSKFTFEVPAAAGGKVTVELILEGDHLRGEVRFHREYGVIKAMAALKRQ